MMFERLFDNTVIPLLSRVAAFTQARHRTILSNIANVETPGYAARDVAESEFERQLREAEAARERTGTFRFTSSSHNRVDREGQVAFEPVPSPTAGTPGPDGNNVNLEQELVALIKNTMRHNTAMELMRKQFALIDAAIRERV